MTMVSCQKGPTHHDYAWQIWPFWQDTLELRKLPWMTNADRRGKHTGGTFSFILDGFYYPKYDLEINSMNHIIP